MSEGAIGLVSGNSKHRLLNLLSKSNILHCARRDLPEMVELQQVCQLGANTDWSASA